MSQLLLLQGNPKKRRGGKRRRSAAQRAATARMLAARGTKVRRRRSGPRKVRHSRRRSSRGFSMARSSFVPMLKSAAVAGAGAVAVDVGMGFAQNMLPASMASRVNADGSVNFLYYATKGALAIGLGMIRAPIAKEMAAGSLTVTAYELIRGFIPVGSLPLGYVNPARVNPPLARITSMAQLGKISTIPGRGVGTGAGAMAARAMR